MDTRNVDWVSHKDYLDSCDYDDLINLRVFLNGRIKSYESEEKVIIYGVAGPNVYEGWFKTYEEAYEHLVKNVVCKLENPYHADDSIGIDSKKVYHSQLTEYIGACQGDWV